MATPGNPNGAVVILDTGNPRIITAVAREAVSGGEFVFVSGATGVVGSGADSYSASDISVALVSAATRFNGIALNTVGSNNILSVATNGAYLLKCGGAVLGGQIVETLGDSVAVKALTSGSNAGNIVGRAITDGASGGFALVQLGL